MNVESGRNYWVELRRARLTRRRFLAAGAVGAAGVAAMIAACANNASKSVAPSSAASAGSQADNDTPQPGGAVTTSNRDNSPNLDLHRTTSGYSKAPEGAVLSRLLRYQTSADVKVSEEHRIEGDLATSWESPEAITWTVKLRPEAKFHNVAPVNGHAVQAEDIKATLIRAFDSKNPARSGLDMIDADQVQTPAPDTVVFKLKYPFASFTTTLASPNYFYIFPREALAGSCDPSKQVIGSGPFTFESYTPDVGWVLKKNPNWFEKGRPYVDEIRWNVIADRSRMLAEFTGGHLDLMGVTDGIPIANKRPADVEAILTDGERLKAYLDIQRYVADKMYAIAGLPQPYVYSMVQPRVHGWGQGVSYGLGTESLSKLWITG